MDHRRKFLGLMGVALGAVLALGPVGSAQDKKPAEPKGGDQHRGHFMECARICDACAAHCARLVAEGKKEHLTTLQTCNDCATFCSAASCITARQGPFAGLICQGCADACKRCGDACEKHKDDPMMRQCAEECRRCEKACREMLQHTAGTERPR